MSKLIQAIFDENFFIINSTNVNAFECKFFGYAIEDQNILIRSNVKCRRVNEYASGIFVNIIKDKDKIIIQQDYFCGFGLYLYRHDDFWALSNSFFCLVEFLGQRFPMTENCSYISTYLTSVLVPPIAKETPIVEISEVPQGHLVEIEDCSPYPVLSVKKIDYDTHSIDIHSDDGIALIESWRQKWISLATFLSVKGYYVDCDLSGGFDTRATLAILGEPIREGHIACINSAKDNLHCHTDDFNIASRIADRMKFRLNSPRFKPKPTVYADTLEAIRLQLFTNFFSSSEFHYHPFISNKPLFHFSGNGGGIWRWYHWNFSEFELFLDARTSNKKYGTIDFGEEICELLKKELSYITNLHNYDVPDVHRLYFYGHMKHADMRTMAGRSLCNMIYLTPLLDPILQKLDLTQSSVDDPYIFYSYLFCKYLPELDGIGFQGNRNVDPKTVSAAKELISSIHSEIPAVSPHVWQIEIEDYKFESSGIKTCDPKQYLIELYGSDNVKRFIEQKYNHSIYQLGIDYLNNHRFFPERKINQLLNTYMLSNLLNPAGLLPQYSNGYKPNGSTSDLVKVLNTSRIDILNSGNNTNCIEIIRIEPDTASVSFPKWFSSARGKGVTIESSTGNLIIEFKCIGTGNLKIDFLASDWKDRANSRVSIKIDYLSIQIHIVSLNNKDEIFQNIYGISHDKRFTYEHPVLDGDKILMEIAFKAHDYTSDDLSQIINKFYDYYGDPLQ